MSKLIDIKNLGVTYANTGKVVFKDLNLSVNRGEVLGILGPSGCGKTTLLSIINRTLVGKEIIIEGTVCEKKKGIIISTVFQAPTLLPWRTVTGNVGYPLEILNLSEKIIDSRTAQALKKVNLLDYASYKPKELSLGMQQKVNLARALCTNPDLVLFDEPLSSLDIKSKRVLMGEIKEFLKDKYMTAIYVTHSIEEAIEIADRILVFGKGHMGIVKEFICKGKSINTLEREIKKCF
jgi:NitT/TauT family transport system ATP-binding protein